MRAGQKVRQRALHRLRADQQRLVQPPPMQQPVGEDVAAVEIGGKLDLVNGDEGEIEIARHGLDGADPVARLRRLDLFFTGDERDGLDTDFLDDAIVDFAGQQPQREADHARAMSEHSLDRIMRLAGVGRPQHERHAPRAVTRCWEGGGEREGSSFGQRLACRLQVQAKGRVSGEGSGLGKVIKSYPAPLVQAPEARHLALYQKATLGSAVV